ncbi:glycosyltransferase family 4 protein [Aliivibrio fischeri]|uniref:glycosyltransferase family 4 protein n=1 Tax=Aliivibrio fischeri TaxID=668 RepID=UPI00080DAB24|nr:glycosyltransferase family 4 protein [Aliivibrio fischeri]OCH42534.1 phosphonate ABC transporter substrate-binding protein [Aliivibrio fischeri]OED54488.1 phosphonate ABC transporter substrate-binding protein [Aliivibrio fischeri]
MTDKITVIGTRGIPNVLGGVETHCQHLYPEIHRQFNTDICVIARSPYVDYKTSSYQGVKTKAVWAPKKKSLEAIIHSTLASLTTLFDGSKVVHVHAIGPGLVVPLLRLLGKKVVFTHHGPDYDRQKWGGFAKRILQLGEKLAATYANEVIVISEVINDIIKEKYNRYDAHLIYNGVKLPTQLPQEKIDSALAKFSLTAGNYFVAVGRFVEEKGFHDLINAYQQASLNIPLVIMGDTDHPTPYSEKLKQQARDVEGVILTGFLKGKELQAIFSQAKTFVMPSYHEGLPIALLEAMSYSLPAIVSNIPANLEVKLTPDTYFPVGDTQELTKQLVQHANNEYYTTNYKSYLEYYDWEKIATQTMAVYQNALTKKASSEQS